MEAPHEPAALRAALDQQQLRVRSLRKIETVCLHLAPLRRQGVARVAFAQMAPVERAHVDGGMLAHQLHGSVEPVPTEVST
ncbi:hypothetical protein R69746_04106 [Paraburkholderia aspalathi]|nr:hypothetical protein R69746_04106 [Paraburkholderia aspalathi]